MCRAVGFGTKRPAPVAGFHRALPSTTRDKAIYFLQRLSYHIPAGLSRAKYAFRAKLVNTPKVVQELCQIAWFRRLSIYCNTYQKYIM